jgi:hypothetical protein
MKRLLSALFAIAVVFAVASSAEAQVYQAYYPAVPYTSYYAPAPATVYYSPAPAAVATTRYRPLIGGTVTRWRYVNQPAVVYPSTVAYYPAW